MFTIRKEQFTTYRKTAYMSYLLKTFKNRWPEQCRKLGEKGLVPHIESCLARAKAHGISKTNNKTRFVNLTFLLDCADFDTEIPWAETILGWESGSEDLKMNALEKRAEREVENRLESELLKRRP